MRSGIVSHPNSGITYDGSQQEPDSSFLEVKKKLDHFQSFLKSYSDNYNGLEGNREAHSDSESSSSQGEVPSRKRQRIEK